MSEIELKPCPLCGGKVFLGIDYESSIEAITWRSNVYYIKCQSCGLIIYGSYGKNDIVNRWNRRVGE